MAKDGIHAVLVVLSVWKPFTKEQATTITSLWTLFGKKVADYMIVVFTGGDELEFCGKTLEDYVGDSEALKVFYTGNQSNKVMIASRLCWTYKNCFTNFV